jgi:hypothetical protein
LLRSVMACHPRCDVCCVSSEIANAREVPQFSPVFGFKKPVYEKILGENG